MRSEDGEALSGAGAALPDRREPAPQPCWRRFAPGTRAICRKWPAPPADPERERSFRHFAAQATDQLGPAQAYSGVTALRGQKTLFRLLSRKTPVASLASRFPIINLD